MIPLFSSCSGEEKLLWIQRGFGVNAFYILPFIEIKIQTLFINHFWKRLRFYKTVEAVHMSRFLFQGELNQGYDIKESSGYFEENQPGATGAILISSLFLE